MGVYIKVLALVVSGIVLLWIGYNLFFGPMSPFYPAFFPGRKRKKLRKKDIVLGKPGDPQICPVCSIKLVKGQQIKTTAFPSVSGGTDRLMYIRGCYSCLNEGVPRKCPICGAKLNLDDYLVARMFDRGKRKNHVHILGCNRCKKMGPLAK
jgi:hypothetical protein